MINAIPYGIPDSSEYPSAATLPDSGTPTTISASTGWSFASILPAIILESYTLTPSILLSGLAKYIYSKIHFAHLSHLCAIFEDIPDGVIVTISPGRTSLTNSAPTASRAHVSDARMYALSRLPMHKGLKPNSSLAPISLRGLITISEYAPFIFFMALATAPSTLDVLSRSLAI